MVGMSIRSPARAAVLVTFLLLFGTPEQLLCQVLGRQRDLGPNAIHTLEISIREQGGRAIIGFKPVDADRGINGWIQCR
jgi:hypothetical protein